MSSLKILCRNKLTIHPRRIIVVRPKMKSFANKRSLCRPRRTSYDTPVSSYTDASIVKRQIGLGIFFERDRQSFAARAICPVIDINYAEILAIQTALHLSPLDDPLEIFTDSITGLCYIQNGITGLWTNQKYNNIIRSVIELIDSRKSITIFTKIKGHSGNYGNEIADKLARHGTSLARGDKGVDENLIKGVYIKRIY
jgi:ribonuclease HI